MDVRGAFGGVGEVAVGGVQARRSMFGGIGHEALDVPVGELRDPQPSKARGGVGLEIPRRATHGQRRDPVRGAPLGGTRPFSGVLVKSDPRLLAVFTPGDIGRQRRIGQPGLCERRCRARATLAAGVRDGDHVS